MVKIKAVIMLLFAAVCFGDTPQDVVTAERAVPSLSEERLNELALKQAEISVSINGLQKSLESISSRLSLSVKDTDTLKENTKKTEEDLRKAEAEIAGILKNSAALSESLEGLKLKMKYMENDSKVKAEDMASLRDTLASIKKNIDVNTEALMDCKKAIVQIRDEKNKEIKKSGEDISSWPVWGIAGAVLGTIALIFAVAR